MLLKIQTLSIVLLSTLAVLVVVGFFFQGDSSVLGPVWLLGPFLIVMGAGFLVDARLGTKKGSFYASDLAVAYTILFDGIFLATYNDPAFILFFLSGFIIVLSMSAAWRFIAAKSSQRIARSSVTMIAFSNPTRKPGQSTLTIAMFGLVVFTLVALAVNISGQQANIDRAVVEQSGGYQVLAEATTPIRFDLGNEEERLENNITNFLPGMSVAQFSTFGSPGGTCSNLNSNLPPRLIGANGTFLQENTFKFSSSRNRDPSDAQGAWSELDEVQPDGAIPIIGDTNTIVWIYGKSVGGTIEISDENGQKRKLLVVGILRSSMFSGSVFLSEDSLDDLFPTKAEYDLFLFKTNQPELAAANIEDDMDSYGVDATLVEEKIKEDLEIEWSYMSLFQTLLQETQRDNIRYGFGNIHWCVLRLADIICVLRPHWRSGIRRGRSLAYYWRNHLGRFRGDRSIHCGTSD